MCDIFSKVKAQKGLPKLGSKSPMISNNFIPLSF
uniref:Uncharacterized protein n=1 Tax=Rhizophora mucronata TaxID=61149 RepID=A0A2P2N1V7_RHIMU